MELVPNNREFSQELFEKKEKAVKVEYFVRPSLSYWQDAILRFKKNKQALVAFGLAIILFGFSFIGPLVWTKDPSQQDLSSPSLGPNLGTPAMIVDESNNFEPKFITVDQLTVSTDSVNKLETPIETSEANSVEAPLKAITGFEIEGHPTTNGVILKWDYQKGASGYSIYRNDEKPSENRLGIPLGDIEQGTQVSFQDTESLEARSYYYSIVPKNSAGEEVNVPSTIKVTLPIAMTVSTAEGLGFTDLKVGSWIRLPSAPLGTDALGRDILARLMDGGRVSLTIGITAALLSMIFGILLGGIAGFFGGTIDSITMRFTDLVSGLPFLLFMILLKVIFNVGPGESGITVMLISLVLLSWTGSARLVRGQILQLRNSEFVSAARLMGARPGYLIWRHMLPNLIGVILVTLTFQVPSAIFTEAFLSFVGLGVAAPATSWGSMCNDGIQSLLTRPYEFFAPSIVISLTVLSFNLVGDGLRDALDPKLRSNE